MKKDMYEETVNEWLSEIGVRVDYKKIDELVEGLLVCDDYEPPIPSSSGGSNTREEKLEKKVEALENLLAEKGYSVYAGEDYISETVIENGLGTVSSETEKKHWY